MTTALTQKIYVTSSDGDHFQIDVPVALQSEVLKGMIEDGCVGEEFPLHNVSTIILEMVIEYCQKHTECEATKAEGGAFDVVSDESLEEWDEAFMKVELDTLYDLMLAANFLDIPSLLDLTCQTVVDMIKGKTSEQIRQTFNIRNDFSPEEEEEIRRESRWAFE